MELRCAHALASKGTRQPVYRLRSAAFFLILVTKPPELPWNLFGGFLFPTLLSGS